MNLHAPLPDVPQNSKLSKYSKALGLAGLLTALIVSGCRVRSSRASTALLLESEPNDGAAFAEGIGAIRPGMRLTIRGSVLQNEVSDSYETDWNADFFDGFAFVVDEPCELYLTLYADRPFADLDLWVYDPFDQSFIARFEDIYDPELGAVVFPWIGEEFHVVVSSYSLDSFYNLEIEAFPLASSLAVTHEDTAVGEIEGRVRPRVVVGQEPLEAEALELPSDRPVKDAGRYELYRRGQLEPAPEPIRIERISLEDEVTQD